MGDVFCLRCNEGGINYLEDSAVFEDDSNKNDSNEASSDDNASYFRGSA